MIFGFPALFLHLLTILILGMVTGTMMASLLVRLVASRLPHYHLAIRRNLLWVFAVFPLFAGVAAALLSYLPEWKPQANLWLADIIHWHHAYLFSPASWHGVFLLFCLIGLLALFAWRGWQGVSEVQRQQLLGLLSERDKDGLAELDTPVPMAFVAGLWSPKAYITRGLASRISAKERRVISLHEQAHICRRDPLAKFAFSLLTCLYPPGVRRFLQAEFELAIEQLADEWVVQRYPQPAIIAQALLQVEKIAVNAQDRQADDAYSYFARHAVERRVHHLLGVSEYRALPVVTVVVLAISATLSSAAGVDVLHHLFETLFLH